ncbi:autotransporter domain-containing protein [Campylobacter hyointestinalis]|uniref:autotransporter domain-containing protein n=1 Tax=Campylobacter hyointestinalis TaxID=198 RepID=UPI0015EEB427|nr:autotransporter domain-containing protein [Campylobacter hyointestinalis]
MQISRAVCATLFGVSLSVSSTFGYSVDEKVDEINKNLRAYNDFYLSLQDKSANMAQKLGNINGDIKNVTADELNTGGKYKELGDIFKFALGSGFTATGRVGLGVRIGEYNEDDLDYDQNLNFNLYEGLIDTGGWAERVDTLIFTTDKGRNVSISHDNNRIEIKFDNGERNTIRLDQDGNLYATSSGSSVNNNTIFQSGLSKNDLATIARLVENRVKDSVELFKAQTLVDGLAMLIMEKDESEYKDNAKFKAMFNEIKKLGNSDDVLKSLDSFHKANAKDLELIKETISKLEEIKTITSDDKSVKIKEFNEFLVKNNFEFGVEEDEGSYRIDGYVSKINDNISDDDLNKFLNMLKAEQKNSEKSIKNINDYMASHNLKAMFDKVFSETSVNLKVDEINKNLKAYNDFYLPLQNESANMAQKLGKIESGIKNITADDLNTGGKYEELGNIFKFVMGGLTKTGSGVWIGEYDDGHPSYEDDGIDTGGYTSVEDPFTFTTEDGRNVSISGVNDNGTGIIMIKFDNGEGNEIDLIDGKLYVRTYTDSSSSYNTIFQGGLSKNDLAKIAGLVENRVKESVELFKAQTLVDGLAMLVLEKDESEYKDNANFKAMFNEIKKLGNSNDVLKSLDLFHKANARELELIKDSISKLEDIKNTTGDKSAKIKAFNEFLVKNNFSFSVDNSLLYANGYLHKITADISDDDLNKILNVLKKEQEVQESDIKNVNELIAKRDIKAILDKLFENEAIDSADAGTEAENKAAENEAIASANQATETEAIAKANQATTKVNDIKSQVANTQKELEQAKLNVNKINADPNATQEQKEQALAKQTELEERVKTEQAELNQARQARNTAIEAKIEAIKNNQANKLGQTEKSVASALASIVARDDIADLLSGDKDSIISAVKDAVNSINTASETINSKVNTDIIKFSADIATNTRLAKLSNPFNEDLALAYAIANLKDDAFADNGDGLSSVVRAYTDRFNYDNGLWATLVGSKSSVKNGVDSKLYGFNIGYDKTFDNTIIGSYLTYAQTRAKNSIINNEADNYQLGIYSRSFVQNSEIDAKLSFGVGKNELKRIQNQSEQSGKYDTNFFAAEATYGYIFDLGNEFYAKPLTGLTYSYVSSKAFGESGKFATNWGKTTQKSLSLKAGVELRNYIADGSYIYITPAYEQEIYKNNNDLRLNYVGSNYDIIIGSGKKKHGYAVVQTGADFSITQNLSTNINFGAKARSGEKYYNGTLGLRYKF